MDIRRFITQRKRLADIYFLQRTIPGAFAIFYNSRIYYQAHAFYSNFIIYYVIYSVIYLFYILLFIILIFYIIYSIIIFNYIFYSNDY